MTVVPRLITATPDGQGAEMVRLPHVPARPALTPGLERRLRAESISLTSAEPTDDKAAARYRSDFLGTVEKPWRPSPLPVSEIPAAQQALAAFDAYLRPQNLTIAGVPTRANSGPYAKLWSARPASSGTVFGAAWRCRPCCRRRSP